MEYEIPNNNIDAVLDISKEMMLIFDQRLNVLSSTLRTTCSNRSMKGNIVAFSIIIVTINWSGGCYDKLVRERRVEGGSAS